MEKYVIYCRVSSKRQGESGLGLEDQVITCRDYVASVGGEIAGEFQDVKSGGNRSRKGLLDALSCARESGATLVFAKLDRLARDAEYAHSIRNSGVPLYFCDFPVCNSFMFGVLVSFAQYEKELGRDRTRDALRSIDRDIAENGFHTAKKSGRLITRLGAPKGWEHTEDARMASAMSRAHRITSDPTRQRQYLLIRNLHGRGNNIQAIADTLNATGEKTPKGCNWSKGSVSQALLKWGKFFS